MGQLNILIKVLYNIQRIIKITALRTKHCCEEKIHKYINRFIDYTSIYRYILSLYNLYENIIIYEINLQTLSSPAALLPAPISCLIETSQIQCQKYRYTHNGILIDGYANYWHLGTYMCIIYIHTYMYIVYKKPL